MIKYLSLSIIFSFLTRTIVAQTVSGNLSQLAQQEIRLEGFKGLSSYIIGKSTVDSNGNFKLSYSTSDIGMGYLTTSDDKPFIVILSGENTVIKGESLSNVVTMNIINGFENKMFEQYAIEYPKRESALSAWDFLGKLYEKDSLFSTQTETAKNIRYEVLRIKKEDVTFLATLPKGSYVSWFLPMRKLVSSVATVGQYRREEIPTTIANLRAVDYSDVRLYKSGLLKDAIDGHFWLLENTGNSSDVVVKDMKLSIDLMLKKLVLNEERLNAVTIYLFDLLERHSLFEASEYLALKLLNEDSCTLDKDLSKQLETYRAMKKGNTAPQIVFEKGNFSKSSQFIKSLSETKSAYTLVAFGASWCPKCDEELTQIASLYSSWKAKGVEVIFIGIEDDKKSFLDFAANFPFSSYSDLKKWDSKSVSDYYVFATPTLFLLNDKREIVLRPISVKQVDAWVESSIEKGAK